SPALKADTRAILDASGDCLACPKMTWSTSAPSIPARRTASSITTAASWSALTFIRAPPRRPTGVRTALTTTTFRTLATPLTVHRAGPRLVDQIGRASCRERWEKYVFMIGAADQEQ